ncbi:hypothetical protein CWC52_09630 [Enterococcus faecium]|nr:hypothetical protein CWC52_09630 [Enterococcus faecium]QCR68070.1 hypothetical protein FBF65_00310 [Enterococcus faecium]
MILDNPEYIESGKSETVNYYYELPIERQDYQIVVRRANGYFVGLPFNRIRQKSPILYRWVMNAVRYEGYRW